MINDQDWQKYVDTGEVGIHMLKDIVRRNKAGEKLGTRDLAVYSSHADILETLLRIK